MTPLARIFWNLVRLTVVIAILCAFWAWFQKKINKD